MFGLAAVTAVAAMAFLGVGSASAISTQLCNTATKPCGSPTTSVHYVNSGVATLLNSTADITCSTVLFQSTKIGPLALPQVIEGNFTYSGCTSSVGSCTVKQTSAIATIKVTKTAAEKAGVEGTAKVLVNCFFGFIHCEYDGTGLKGSAEGSGLGNNVTIQKQTVNKIAGSACPATAELDIVVKPLANVFISE